MNAMQESGLYLALRIAVLDTIDAIGADGVRVMSMFPSSKWSAKNDNTVLALSEAA